MNLINYALGVGLRKLTDSEKTNAAKYGSVKTGADGLGVVPAVRRPALEALDPVGPLPVTQAGHRHR